MSPSLDSLDHDLDHGTDLFGRSAAFRYRFFNRFELNRHRGIHTRDLQKVKAVFADSFYFLALLRLDDSAHARALAASPKRSERLVTTAWVLTEVADALAVPGMSVKA